jgi:hypothetical protein
MKNEQKELIEKLKPYLTHKSFCNVTSNWDEAIQAMGDTPEKFRDESWHLTYNEIHEKMNICNCGLEQLESSLKKSDVQSEYYKKVEIKSVDDLPKENGDYIVHSKQFHDVRNAEFKLFENEHYPKYNDYIWMLNFDWYLQPIQSQPVSPKSAEEILQKIASFKIETLGVPESMAHFSNLKYSSKEVIQAMEEYKSQPDRDKVIEKQGEMITYFRRKYHGRFSTDKLLCKLNDELAALKEGKK